MIELTDEQRQQLESGKVPHYDDSEWTVEELRTLLARSSRENGWEEPGMDAYDRYDEQLRKR